MGLLLLAGVTHYTFIYDREKGHVCLQYVIHMMPLSRCAGDGGGCAFTQTAAGQKPLLEYTALIFTTCVFKLMRNGVSPTAVQPSQEIISISDNQQRTDWLKDAL